MTSSLSLSCSAGAEEGGGRFWDELHRVGLPDGFDVRTLFDESGKNLLQTLLRHRQRKANYRKYVT